MRKQEAPWPEIAIDPDISIGDFSDCLKDHGTPFVWGEGNPDGSMMIVLDNPGARVDKNGAPFACATRLTLYHALEEAGIDADRVYLTYLLKRRPRRAYDRARAYRSYGELLRRQIDRSKATVLVYMGNNVVHALLGPESDVKALRNRSLCERGRPVVVTYHPLAAHLRPSLFPILVQDLTRAARNG